MSEPTSNNKADLNGTKAVLIVEDDAAMRRMCTRILTSAGYKAEAVSDGETAIARLREGASFHVALVDLRLPKLDGTVVLEQIRKMRPDIVVVIMTGYATVRSAVKAMKLGAADYMIKPFEKDELLTVVAQQFRVLELENQVQRLHSELHGKYSIQNIVSRSKKMEHVFEHILAARGNKANVLIVGESGTGKELIAKAIHHSGRFANAPFVAVNCAALPETLIESELFGYTKGAFTGATSDSAGLFRSAQGGTILLDEIFEMPSDLQVKLLRIIQERAVRPVGGVSETPIDVRVIAATNHDPSESLEKGGLRKDLYYRLSVITIHVPPLRERREDICHLIDHFTVKFAKIYGFDIGPIQPGVMDILNRYSWPGNIRELENLVEKWFALGLKNSVTVSHLPEKLVMEAGQTDREVVRDDLSEIMPLHEAERALVKKTMEATGYNKTKAASFLGISRKKLYKILGNDIHRKDDNEHS